MIKEIIILKEMLEEAGIAFEMHEIHGGHQICYPSLEDKICSAIQHNFSYGGCDNKIEIMGLLTESESLEDNVLGWLSAQEVFDRIEAHYNNSEI